MTAVTSRSLLRKVTLSRLYGVLFMAALVVLLVVPSVEGTTCATNQYLQSTTTTSTPGVVTTLAGNGADLPNNWGSDNPKGVQVFTTGEHAGKVLTYQAYKFKLWDPSTNGISTVLNAYYGSAHSYGIFCLNHDNTKLYLYESRKFRIFDVATWTDEGFLKWYGSNDLAVHSSGSAYSCAADQNGNIYLSANDDIEKVFSDPSSSYDNEVVQVCCPDGSPRALSVSGDGSILYYTTSSKIMKRDWQAYSEVEIASTSSIQYGSDYLSLSYDESTLYYSNYYGIWKLDLTSSPNTWSVLAGDQSSYGLVDGTGTTAKFRQVKWMGITADNTMLYVIDDLNYALRSVSTGADVTTQSCQSCPPNSTSAGGSVTECTWECAADMYVHTEVMGNPTPGVVTTAFGPNPYQTYQDIAVFRTGPNLGKALVTSQGTYGIYTWNLETNDVTSFFDLNSLSHMPTCICLNADNTKVYYGRSSYLYQVDINTPTHEGRLTGYSGSLGTVTGCTVDSDGDIYIAAQTSTKISKLSSTGGSWSMADQWVFSSENYKPTDVIISADKSTLYWTDEQNRALYKTDISSSTSQTAQLVANSNMYFPYSLTFSSADETSVFISAYYQIWKADLNSPYTLEVFAGPTSSSTGDVDGTGTDARFNQLKGMAISNDYGTLYVADRTNYALRTVTTGYFTSTESCQACEPGSVSVGGNVTSCTCVGGYHRAGVEVSSGPAGVVETVVSSGLSGPMHIAVFTTGDNVGKALVVDTNNYKVKMLDLSNNNNPLSDWAGSGSSSIEYDGSGTFIGLGGGMYTICLNTDNTKAYLGIYPSYFYEIDVASVSVNIFRDSSNTVLNIGASYPRGCDVDTNGVVYVAANSPNTLLKLTSQGSSWSTETISDFTSQNYKPYDVAVTADGTKLYWIDEQYKHLMQTVLSGPTTTPVTTIAMDYGTKALLLTSDESLVYVGGYYKMYTVDLSDGSWTILAGSSGTSAGFTDGTGTSALVKGIAGIGSSSDGMTLYFVEQSNNAVRSVSTGASVTTYTGPCTSCDPGYTSLVSDANTGGPDVCFYDCPAGQYVDSGTTCVDCPTDYTSAGGIPDASQCYFDCPAGEYAGTGASCLTCPVPFTSLASSGSVEDCKCGAGTYLDGSLCTGCPSDSTSPFGSTSVDDCACAPGFTGPKESCTACNPGYYKSTAGSGACAQCDASLHESTSTLYGFTSCSCKEGFFRNTNDLCQACVSNEYKDHVGNDDCTECTANSETTGTGASAANQCLCSKGYENTEANTESMPSCHACGPGEYKESASNILECVSCPDEATTLHTASFTVTDCQCVAGHEGLILTDTDTCADCDAGTFKSNIGTQDCGACPTGATSPSSSTASTDCTCTNIGYTGPNGGPCVCAAGFTGENCVACAVNTFKSTTGDAACTSCSSDSSSPSGSTASTDCTCNAGFTGADGGQCDPCDANEYKPTTGSAGCTGCPANTVSPSGSDAIEDCVAAAGYYGTSTTTITKCPDNTNSVEGATVVGDCTCNVGYTGPDGGGCTACSEGEFKDTQGSAACTSCGGVAFYSPEASDSSDDCVCALGYTGASCDACETGKYKTTTGSAACTPCDSDASSPSASTAASDCGCNIGYFGDGHTTCDACGAGTYQDVSGSTACKGCTPNSNSAPGSDESTDCVCNEGYAGAHGGPCVVCTAGQYEDTATHICENCPDNSHSSSGSTLTDCLCNAGYTGPDGGLCSACDVGEYKDTTGSSACLSCDAQATSPAGSTSSGCACLPGYTGDGVSCSECLEGKFKDTTENVACTPCPENSQSAAGAIVCLCNAGFFGPADSCSQCEAGTYKSTAGTDACTGCPENTYSPTQSDDVTDCVCNAGYTGPDGLACLACGTGKYKPLTGSGTCTACPSYSASPAASTAETDCVCNAGYGGDDGGPCILCLAKTYEDTASNTCLSCPANTNSNPGSDELTDCTCVKGYTGPDGTECTACGVNHYKDTTGSAGCTECTDFSSSPTASDDVSDCVCNSGYHHAGDGSCDLECAAGYEAGPHELQCLQCANGKYKTTVGDHSCVNCMDNSHHTELAATSIDACICNHGFYKSLDGLSCNACEIGKFNNQAGEGQCFDCFSDTSGSCVSATGTQTECPDLCQAPAGYQVTASGVNLEPCPANTYNDGSLTTCQSCPSPSTYTSATGSTSVSDCICQPGYYRDNGVCTACGQGSYKSDTGDAVCDLCTATDTNTNTLATASTSVSDCLCVANYELRDGSCQTCLAGGAKHIIGNDACIDCTDFATLADNGVHAASSCLCDPGYTGNHLTCSSCLVGQYKPTSGPDLCSDCVDHATSPAASDSISDCYCPPPLWEDGDPGPTDPSGSCVSSCDPGTFKGESACENCIEGTYKPDRGPHACTPCSLPRNASAAGSDSVDDCSCGAGEMGLAGEHTVIQSIGALSEAGLDVQTFTSSSTIPDTNKRYKSLQLTSAFDVTVSIAGVVLFRCTIDCGTFGVIPLYNLPGQLQLTMTSGTATITQYTRRELVVTHTPSWYNAAAAEALALQDNLQVGDFLFNPTTAVFSTTVCVTCAPGVVCKPFI